MATFYGNETQNFRAYGTYSTSETATTMTISLTGGMQACGWGFDVGYVDCTATVDGSSATTYNNDFYSPTGGWTATGMASKSKTINKGSSSKTVTLAVSVYNHSGYHDGTSNGSTTITVPAITYSKPNAPSSCSATRNSDTQATVTWTNGSTDTTHPRSATLVERSTNGGSWTQVASVSSSATSYADDGISANHSYQYMVRAQNSAGYSDYAQSGTIYTTPAAPTAVTATKTANTTVSVAATVDAPYATGYDIESSVDGGSTWASEATNTSLPYTDTVTGTIRYRVRSVRGTLKSAWKSSSDITTIVPPLAPTITQKPSDPTVKGSQVRISWTPNHPDGTSQSAAQVKVTYPDGSSSTLSHTTSTTRTMTCSQTGAWTAQVRTKGLDESYGAWSEVISWGVYERPVVNITSPASDGDEVESLPTTIEWDVTDSTGVASQRLVLKDNTGKTVFSSTPSASSRSRQLTVSDVSLDNGASYSITITVNGGSGLSQSATRTFVVDWLSPAPPTIEIEEGDGKSARIVVTYNDGDAATSFVDVMRVDSDGSSWPVATSVENGGIISDPLPPLNVPVQYVGVASTSYGSSASATFAYTFSGEGWALNFGETAQHEMTLMYALSNARTLDHGGKSYHFADGGAGGGLPVFYPTTDREQGGTLKFALIYHDDADRLFELSDKNPVGWIRDANGRRWRAKITIRESYIRGPIFRMTADWEAVRWREAW